MSRKHGNLLIISAFLVALRATEAFSEEQCVASFDQTSGIVHIPCMTIGEEKFWVNLERTSTGELLFEINGYGEGFVPLWLRQVIDDLRKVPDSTLVRQHRYKDNVVYYVLSPCCDQFNYLYDLNGNIICAPDGGFSGRGDEQCPDFYETSTEGVVIWENPRLSE